MGEEAEEELARAYCDDFLFDDEYDFDDEDEDMQISMDRND